MPPYLRALGSRNYRIYFAGQLVSLAGTWMQQIAMVWLAYRLTGSAFVLGVVGFASQIPILVLGAFGGVMTDRFDRRRLLLVTQALSMAQALLLALLAWQNAATPAHLIMLAFGLWWLARAEASARRAGEGYGVAVLGALPRKIARVERRHACTLPNLDSRFSISTGSDRSPSTSRSSTGSQPCGRYWISSLRVSES